MGVLDHLEKGSERAVHDVVVAASRSEVQPVEIASEVRRARDDHAEPSRMMQQIALGGSAGDAVSGGTVTELIAKAVMEAVLRR